MKELPHTLSCFVCGETNPIGLNLRFQSDGRVVQARFSFRPEHVGFHQTIHGGLVATLLDEIMVWACAVTSRRFAFCAELSIRFVKPVRPQIELIGKAELTANRRNRIYEAKSELRDASNALLATGTGKYLPMKEAEASQMSGDFVGTADWASASTGHVA